jgi:hypothetical protein
MRQITCWVGNSEYEELQKISNENNTTVSNTVREIIRFYLTHRFRPSRPDIEKRVKALEEKVDEIYKKLDVVIYSLDKVLTYLYQLESHLYQLERERLSRR